MVIIVVLLSHTSDPEKTIETAYLQCRNAPSKLEGSRKEKTFEQRMKAMMKGKHFGPLEHASATFQIHGTSRVFTHELVRHRLASYCQVSSKHVRREDLGLIIPPTISENSDHLALFQKVAGFAASLYEHLIKEGVPIEDARYILPQATEAPIVMTANFREWVHILKLRLPHPPAQWEISTVMGIVWKRLREIAPNVFDDKWREYWE